jgi:hypothetical protein
MFEAAAHMVAVGALLLGGALLMWTGGLFALGGCATKKHGGRLTHMEPIYCGAMVGGLMLFAGVRPRLDTAESAIEVLIFT